MPIIIANIGIVLSPIYKQIGKISNFSSSSQVTFLSPPLNEKSLRSLDQVDIVRAYLNYFAAFSHSLRVSFKNTGLTSKLVVRMSLVRDMMPGRFE